MSYPQGSPQPEGGAYFMDPCNCLLIAIEIASDGLIAKGTVTRRVAPYRGGFNR